MATSAPIDNDLWIDDSEIEEFAASLERILRRPFISSTRPTFYSDYYEAD